MSTATVDSRAIRESRGKSYLTSRGDVLDKVCFYHYGKYTSDVLNAVVVRNPWLASASMVLPEGKVIILPVLAAETLVAKKFKLWTLKKVTLIAAAKPKPDKKKFNVNQAELDKRLRVYRSRKKTVATEEAALPYSSYNSYTAGPLTDPYGTSFGQDALLGFV